MTKVWLVQCDFCSKIIDALKEPFFQSEVEGGQHACEDCFNATQTPAPVIEVIPPVEVLQ